MCMVITGCTTRFLDSLSIVSWLVVMAQLPNLKLLAKEELCKRRKLIFLHAICTLPTAFSLIESVANTSNCSSTKALPCSLVAH